MKKVFSFISAILIVCTLVVSSVATYFAVAVYIVNGYSYNIINNTSIALCGWDNSTPELIVPDMLAERYFVTVADYGLQYNTEITSVDFSQTQHLQYIGTDAFRECTGIANELIIPETVTGFGERAFQGCSSLPSAVINAVTTTIPKQCFYKCSSLESVVLPESLTTIQAFAFADCTALNSVNIPATVTSIAKTAFQNDNDLTLGVYYGSYAHTYAIENNIPYVLLDDVKLGDVDGDGDVNINDVTVIQRHLAELEQLEGIYFHAADTNQDGTVDISDATTLQMYLAEYDIPYPIGEIMTQ